MNEIVDHISARAEFEQQYILLRKKEGRIYPDEQVRLLPVVANDHPLKREWKMRKFSADKLIGHIKDQKRLLNILEVGCGNGWLTNQLSLIPGSRVTGVDVNSIELEQAKRVFINPQLQFVYGDIRNMEMNTRFDLILFAASLQYFQSAQEIISTALTLLADGGEVHIMDTHFYKQEELAGAVQRSRAYFNENGFSMMDRYYFHHPLESLNGFSYQVMYDPGKFVNRILKHSPFPWIRIEKC